MTVNDRENPTRIQTIASIRVRSRQKKFRFTVVCSHKNKNLIDHRWWNVEALLHTRHGKQTFAQHARAGRVWSNARSFGTEHVVSPSLNPLALRENVFQAGYRANIVPRSITVLSTRRPRLLTLFRAMSHVISVVRGSQRNIVVGNSLIFCIS